MAASLMARLRESQSKPTVQPAPEQMQQSTGQQLPRSLIGFLRQQQASQEKTAPQATARHRNLFEAALQQQEQQMPQNAAQAPQAAERPRNLVEFMLQAQALNQQPDSIPAMMKPGEYVLPPDTVAAMGGPGALDATVAQTHVPGNQQAAVPPGFEPKHFFANGGLVEDEQPQQAPAATPNPAPDAAPGGQPAASRGFSPAAPATPSPAPAQTPRAQFVADQNQKLAAANTQLAERTAQLNERYKPSPNSPSNTFPGNRMLGAASTAPNVGQPVGQLAGQEQQQANAGAGLANTASKGLAALAGIPTPNSQPPGAAPGGSAVGQKAEGLPPNLFEAAKAQEAQQVPGLSGVYKHGEGQYSDNAQGMGLPQNLGQPSAQNMQAANNLAGQEQKRSMMSVMREQQAQQQMQQPRGFAAPQIQHSGNSSTSKDELRRLRWAAESAMANAPRKKYAMQDPAVMAYQAALQGDTAARYGGQAALEAKTNDTNAGLVREQMQQDGANQREVGQSAIARDRIANEQRQQAITNDLAERRLALDDRKAGTANVPSGYRASADGQGLEAIPGGPADPRTSKAALQRREDAGYVTDILDMARPLVEKSTGSYLGAAVDKAAQVVGQSTDGGNAAAQLKVLQGALVSKMPRMEGPQSDKDVQLYREMAAQIGDSTVPRQQRMEAMNTLEMLQQKYAPAQQAQDGQGEQQRRVMRTGVYNGRRVVQYEDGSLSYAD